MAVAVVRAAAVVETPGPAEQERRGKVIAVVLARGVDQDLAAAVVAPARQAVTHLA